LAYIEPRETWTEAELLQFDGTTDDATGPLLFAASGTVFNVWKGRHLYGRGCEYHIFAGRDATRLLAKSKSEEETLEERSVPLSIAERATLEGWYWIFNNKYDVCGKLEGCHPKSGLIFILQKREKQATRQYQFNLLFLRISILSPLNKR
jgi:membrane-associated progesterone receptor component